MKIENQVCSLELSKKIKELGVKQESLFYWRDNDGYEDNNDFSVVDHINTQITSWFASAFTASELLEILPNSIATDEYKFYRFNMSRALIGEATDFIALKRNFIVNYVADHFFPIVKDNGEYEWPTVFSNLIKHNIYDKKLSNACAKMLIHLIENKIWKPME